jgi:uncharacterized membrane protein
MVRQRCAIATVIVLTMCASLRAEGGPARIEHLGSFSVSDVSSDGRVVVGTGDGVGGLGVIRWEGGVAEVLGRLGEHTFGYGVSGDGTVVVGADYDVRGVRWTRQTGLQRFGGGTASDASYDGSVIVGDRYRWTQQGGFQPLSANEALEPSPRKMNADGSVIVGTGRDGGADVAFRWTAGGGIVFLPDLATGGSPHDANALTADGSVIVGTAYLASGTAAFLWTAGGGSVALPHLPNYDAGSANSSSATAVSADGSVVYGHEPVRGPAFGHEAFAWDAVNGTRPLKDVLQAEYGIDLTDWRLETVAALSEDGTTLIGNGSHPVFGNAAFRVVVPEPSAIAVLAMPLLLFRRRR